jgi:hypothetical protein
MRRACKAARGRRLLVALVLMLLAELGTGVIVGGLRPVVLRAQTYGGPPAPAFRLVSAQVVTTSGGGPPLLRLAANGPIAFRALAAEEAEALGVAPGSRRLVVHLYGLRPGDLAGSGDLAPFSVIITPASDGAGSSGSDAIVNVGLANLPPDAVLHARAGQRVNELEFVVMP